ncbi:1-acyl-sn-glycerol-3-phosphate acyltransferase [Dactylosporangium vinaceum]|uniref:Lysophospholipid acyltransferase family protein n=1 Tax=Dactylosporangium vinaceum TaxID=53362 RepID=A0ABV5MR54_9ACTN|nr:lysophospholipid acyltransferase family protein [Dactylosporangium vinaceum]UAC00558.1 1-acyl-sn-glycerol-3-phosphate acyltransferase [Dactylosporangium vinaceum]
MLRAFSVAYWVFIAITCPIFYVGAVIVAMLAWPFDRRRVLLHLYTSVWAVSYIWLNPLWRLRVSGRAALPWRGPAVLVANHASLIDIIALFAVFHPFKWVSKREIFSVPFIGWNMRLNGYVALRRGDRDSVRHMMATCDRLLAAGSPIMLFPEGSRTPDGTLQRFKDGAFELARRHGVPVFPIAVHGTGRALPKHGMILRDQIDARIEVLPALDPAAFPDLAGLREATRAAIAEALAAAG